MVGLLPLAERFRWPEPKGGLVHVPFARELGGEVSQEAVHLGHVFLNPTVDVPPMDANAQDALEATARLRQGATVEIQPEGRGDSDSRFSHPWELAIVEELMAAVLALVQLLPLACAIPDDFHRSTPLTRTPPGRSFIGQGSVRASGGTVGFDARNIDLSGPRGAANTAWLHPPVGGGGALPSHQEMRESANFRGSSRPLQSSCSVVLAILDTFTVARYNGTLGLLCSLGHRRVPEARFVDYPVYSYNRWITIIR